MTAARTTSRRTGTAGRCAPATARLGRWSDAVEPSTRPMIHVAVGADLDASTGPRLADRVADLVRCGADVTLDTTAVGFVDCAGLAALERCALLGRDRVTLVRGHAVERLVDLVDRAAPGGTSPVRPPAVRA